MRDATGGAVVLGDALQGGSVADRIPPAVQEAFVAFMGKKADSLSEMRRVLFSQLRATDGGWRSFNDRAVMGFISKLKGQIGENIFVRHVGDAACLPTSRIQEGWGVAVRQAHGAYEYVQVKLYGSASGVVRHMLDVQEKALNGTLTGVGEETVSSVFFAVPNDISEDVIRLAGRHEGLADMIYERGVPISAKDASGLVTEGMASVGPERLTQLLRRVAVRSRRRRSIARGCEWVPHVQGVQGVDGGRRRHDHGYACQHRRDWDWVARREPPPQRSDVKRGRHQHAFLHWQSDKVSLGLR